MKEPWKPRDKRLPPLPRFRIIFTGENSYNVYRSNSFWGIWMREPYKYPWGLWGTSNNGKFTRVYYDLPPKGFY